MSDKHGTIREATGEGTTGYICTYRNNRTAGFPTYGCEPGSESRDALEGKNVENEGGNQPKNRITVAWHQVCFPVNSEIENNVPTGKTLYGRNES